MLKRLFIFNVGNEMWLYLNFLCWVLLFCEFLVLVLDLGLCYNNIRCVMLLMVFIVVLWLLIDGDNVWDVILVSMIKLKWGLVLKDLVLFIVNVLIILFDIIFLFE